MANQWYYTRNGQRCGPVTEDQVRQFAATGQIQATDLVWTNGMAEWTQAGTVFPPPSIPDLPPQIPGGPPPLPPVVVAAGPPPLVPQPIGVSPKARAFCQNCGQMVDERAAACMSCGVAPTNGNRFCRNCGTQTNPAALVCTRCGVPTGVPTQQAVVRVQGDGRAIFPSNPPKDPVLICVLSVLLPGLGQIILGQVGKGVMLVVSLLALFPIGFITCGVGWFLYPVVWLVAAVDAPLIASKLKQGKAVQPWEFF